MINTFKKHISLAIIWYLMVSSVGCEQDSTTEPSPIPPVFDTSIPWESGLPQGEINAITAIDSIIFAGGKDGILLSTDNGSNWVAANNGLPANTTVGYLTSKLSVVYAAVTARPYIYRSTDLGNSWHPLMNSQTMSSPTALIASAWNDVTLIAAHGSELYALSSNDIWSTENIGIPNHVNVTALNYSEEGRLYAGTSAGGIMYRSSFTAWASIPVTFTTSSVTAIATTRQFDPGRFRYSLGMIVGTHGNGVYVSLYPYESWVQENDGIPEGTIVSSVYDKINDHNYIVLGTNHGVFLTWVSSENFWGNVSLGLPSTGPGSLGPIDVRFVAMNANYIFVSVWGHGVWKHPIR